MRKNKLTKQKTEFIKNATQNTLSIMNLLLEILKLKLIIKILEILDK